MQGPLLLKRRRESTTPGPFFGFLPFFCMVFRSLFDGGMAQVNGSLAAQGQLAARPQLSFLRANHQRSSSDAGVSLLTALPLNQELDPGLVEHGYITRKSHRLKGCCMWQRAEGLQHRGHLLCRGLARPGAPCHEWADGNQMAPKQPHVPDQRG